ncbi:MAG: methyltransferase domain-containing protein [Brevundimonas sp.]
MTQTLDPADFYTGLVADLYGPLRSHVPDAEPYAQFVGAHGEPALELGCGDGDPLLELRARGLDVDGVDSSADMLVRARRRAAAAGVEVDLHHARMQALDLPRRYRSIYLAGPTFCLLPDDETALAALRSIREHLTPDGAVLVPLWVPPPTPHDELGVPRTDVVDGTTISVTILGETHDVESRTRRSRLLYERSGPEGTTSLEREWTLHWYTVAGFTALAAEAGLAGGAVGPDDSPVFTLVRA